MQLKGYQNILIKLEEFTRKYYTKMLIKGIMLFLAFGVLFFLATIGIEYLLWLNTSGRFVLLVLLVIGAIYLLFRYVLTPVFYLFKLKKGISHDQASILIGKHFPDVGDKLKNLLDLANDANQSELLLASIQQRSESLNGIPFARAVDLNENRKYLKYLAIPLLLVVLIWISGNLSDFFGSYTRVVNYDTAYEPPAPFHFKLLNTDLDVLDSETIIVQVVTDGEVNPEMVYIDIKGKKLLLQESNGIYTHKFVPPLENTKFRFSANEVISREYEIQALKTPTIKSFELRLNFPGYLNRKSEILRSTGNASFPEGTAVEWSVKGDHITNINLVVKDTSFGFRKSNTDFQLNKTILNDFEYEIVTSNANVKGFEKLAYNFKVIKDEFPSIKAQVIVDSLNPNTHYYFGEATDDYKVENIRLICYPDRNPDEKQILNLEKPNSNFKQFYYTFPSGLVLDQEKNYSYYFEAIDNDRINHGKSSKSKIFQTRILNTNQLKNKELQSQQKIIEKLDESLEQFKDQQKELLNINQEHKQKDQLNYNDQSQVKDFLKRQQLQEQMMQKFSKQLKSNFEKKVENDPKNELLKERLERQEIEAKNNEKLLNELQKVADKIDKEELSKRLEEIAKKQQNSERNLEQLLELTKRYYVTEKMGQLAKELETLARKQELLSELNVGEDFGSKEQEDLNKEFNVIAKELEELKKDNANLKKPLNIDVSKEAPKRVQSYQNIALDEIRKHQGEEQSAKDTPIEEHANTAKKRQKAAAQKMKEIGEQLQQSSMSAGGGSSVTEDAEMLRQILDNLVTFSFKQERLFEELESINGEVPQYSVSIREQQRLRRLFEHIDDSLFALSLRRAELAEFVNEQITEIFYNTDKSLESIADNRIYQGISHQKYVLTAANSLSDFLASTLDNMQQSMQSGQGEGEGEGFQLPDIIKQQNELKEKIEGMGSSGAGKPNQGEGEGEKGKGKGKAGKEGEAGKGDKNAKGPGGDGKEGSGKGDGSGKSMDKGEGSGSGGSSAQGEEELKEIYEIYKEQQLIKERLEEQLKEMINAADRKLGEKLLRQMEDFENDLLENGFTNAGLNKVNNIQYELLKLENAALKQGQKQERESNQNTNNFANPITTKPSLLDDYRNEIEILNRQALPLRQNFLIRVKDYFQIND